MSKRKIVYEERGRPKLKIIVGLIFIAGLLSAGLLTVGLIAPDSIITQSVRQFYNSYDSARTALKSVSSAVSSSTLPEEEKNSTPAPTLHEGEEDLTPTSAAPSDGVSEQTLALPLTPSTVSPQAPPQPGSLNTPIWPYYSDSGDPPTAPGLAMCRRNFRPESRKMAYLTFDDGPYSDTTPQILDILAVEDVRATFFVIGSQAKAYPDLIKAEYEQGHGIGNHTYSHKTNIVYRGPQAFLAEVKKAEDVIYTAIGVRPQIVRAPGGTASHFNIDYYNTVDAAGYLMEDWNVDPGDTWALLVPKQRIIDNVRQQIQGKDRVVILLHDLVGKTTTIEALPEIIELLRQEGFSFGVLGPDVKPVLFSTSFRN